MKKLLLLFTLLFLYEYAEAQMLEVKRRNSLLIERSQKNVGKVSEEKKDYTETDTEDVDNQDTNLQGLGNFTFNGRKLVPNIQIIGDRVSRPEKDSLSRFYSRIELFSGVDPPSSEQSDYKSNFFIPEFSTYGLNTTIAWCRKKGSGKNSNGYENKGNYDKAFIGFIANASILEKSYKKVYDTLNIKKDFFTVNSFLSAGAELVFPKTYTSLYCNLNLNSVLTNRSVFLENLKTRNRDFCFITTGIRSQLNLASKESSSNILSFDLGLILQSKGMSDLIGNDDFCIPVIRVNFRHSFLSR